MRPHDGPWAIVHCPPCQQSVDLWYDEPQVVEAEVEPYKPDLVGVDPETLEFVDLTWLKDKERSE